MKSKHESTALTAQNNGFEALADNDFSRIVSDELDGLDIGFERIKIPSGGATMYELPSEDDDAETVKEFSGVILFHHTLNAYYKTKYTGGSNPPDCGSFDGLTGEGDPGGNCKKCPYNVFGTGENGSKACKNRRRVYILREGEVFPLLLSLPTGSLKIFAKYIKAQLSKGRKTNSIVTRFSLKKVVNSTGIAYSQANFTLDRVLTPEEYALIAPLSDQVKAYARKVGYETDIVSDADEESYVDPETGEIIEPLSGERRDV
jgi:hypothetical protein